MELINLSSEPVGKLYSWLPHDIQAQKVVYFPDACPGKSPLPTGTAVFTKQSDWRKFALSDCGCGMRLIKSTMNSSDLDQQQWDELANRIIANKGKLGDLGGGNHFLDAILPYDEDLVYFLIHTGSRHESGLVDDLVDEPTKFDQEFNRIVQWAEDNRAQIHKEVDVVFGETELILDLPHNTFEIQEEGGVVIRKGSVKLEVGQLAVIPSHMSGDVVMVKATYKIKDVLNSMSHGTGRKMSRSDCKPLAESFDFEQLRRQIMMPSWHDDASLRTEGPFAYRDLDECLSLINGYVTEEKRFSVMAYMGHL